MLDNSVSDVYFSASHTHTNMHDYLFVSSCQYDSAVSSRILSSQDVSIAHLLHQHWCVLIVILQLVCELFELLVAHFQKSKQFAHPRANKTIVHTLVAHSVAVSNFKIYCNYSE